MAKRPGEAQDANFKCNQPPPSAPAAKLSPQHPNSGPETIQKLWPGYPSSHKVGGVTWESVLEHPIVWA